MVQADEACLTSGQKYAGGLTNCQNAIIMYLEYIAFNKLGLVSSVVYPYAILSVEIILVICSVRYASPKSGRR